MHQSSRYNNRPSLRWLEMLSSSIKTHCGRSQEVSHPRVNVQKPYEPQNRRHSRRGERALALSITDWRARLGYPTMEVTRQTIQNTTQLVQTLQAETREYMRDHYKTRVWALHP